ncbi:hypothetical protein [Polaromonas sp.]|uniref:hypothetical protein n=1 Tax=Polaromonas sp. TaxID=1869339 RepID=UPI0025F13DD6|nr:hypothetical protein [Polaromonas sp.]
MEIERRIPYCLRPTLDRTTQISGLCGVKRHDRRLARPCLHQYGFSESSSLKNRIVEALHNPNNAQASINSDPENQLTKA